jgi:26S proteasome regulatory subunit N7
MSKPSSGAPSATEETAAPYPNMDFCQKMHCAIHLPHQESLQVELFNQIAAELENPSLYRHLRDAISGSMQTGASPALLTEDGLKAMENKLAAELEELERKVEEAKESAGDMEVMDARLEIARFAAKSLSEAEALEAYQKVIDLPKLSSGKKIDALMESARVASFYGDSKKADHFIEQADKLANEGSGGDWDRRNRLKVYKGLQFMLHRDMEAASKLLLDCIATFTCNEICTYSDFIVYAILTNMLHLPRPGLKKHIIDGPEIISVATEIPQVVSLFLFIILLAEFVLVYTDRSTI